MKPRNFFSALRRCVVTHSSSERAVLSRTPPSRQPQRSPAPVDAPTRRRGRHTASVFAVALFTSTAFAQSPNDFSTRTDVVAPPGASIVRAALPAASIAALRGANGGDLRVFNASGVSLPHALIDASTEARGRADVPGQRIVALPIYASTTSISSGAPTLRIEDGPNRRVIESSTKATPTPQQEPRGLLFDTRKVDTEVRAVELEGTLPNAMIMKVSLEISADLKAWRPLVVRTARHPPRKWNIVCHPMNHACPLFSRQWNLFFLSPCWPSSSSNLRPSDNNAATDVLF